MFKYSPSPASTDTETAVSSFFIQGRALEQLRDAIALLPLQQQAAYREALLRCPSLVEKESDPMQFLLFADFNAWNAATRLVTYWQKRKEVYGEKAFLPVLDLSGNGALTLEDVKLIMTGSFLLTAEDTVVVDRTLELENVHFSLESQLHRNFFFHQLLAQHRANAMPGKGYTFVVRYKRFKTMEARVASKTSEIASQAFPTRIKALHLVFAANYQMGFIRNAVCFLCKLWGMSSSTLLLHHCETSERALLKLVPHGVLPSSLPSSLGGTYQSDVVLARFLAQLGYAVPSRVRGDSCSQGSENHFTDDTGEDSAARNVRCLHEAIDNLSDNDKAAYIQAIRQAPELVDEESPPLAFLEYADFDAATAATRLCNYWRHRLEVFEDRAFLPMTLKGAMGTDGKKALEVGTHFLPREDKFGRSVWCSEPFLMMSSDPEVDFKMPAKALYYTVSKVMKNPYSKRDGFRGILTVCQIEIPFIDSRWRTIIFRVGAIFKESFPHSNHLSSIRVDFFTELFYKFLIRIYTTLYGEPQNIHFLFNAEAQEQMRQKFDAIGISKEGLPKQVGGQDGPLEFDARQRLEESRSASPSVAEVSRSALTGMQTALSLIPSKNKAAYLEALSKAPELAEQASIWESFIRFTRCNAAKAASMFAKYWEVRKELFGNRAFLPLNQTFEGALERKDVAVLQTGYFMQLPCVESGESVLYCDGTKLQRSSSSLSRARSKFYMLSIMAENPTSQTRGFNLLYFLSDPSFDRVFKEHFIEKILPVIPVRLNEVHFLSLDQISSKGNDTDGSVEARMSATNSILDFRRTAGSSTVESHVCASREDLFKKLARHGFSKEGLPKTVFGEMGYDGFVKWQELRIRYEWGLFTNSKELEISSRYLIPRNKLILHEEESEKVERKRRMTIILSRKKRERERMSFEELEEKAMEQRERYRKVRRLNETLQELIEKAKGIVNE